MAYNSDVADMIRVAMDELGIEAQDKKMFGGIAWMIEGNMSAGVHRDSLIVRCGPDRWEEALGAEEAEPFAITGKSMRGFVMIPGALDLSQEQFTEWVKKATDFATSLPAK